MSRLLLNRGSRNLSTASKRYGSSKAAVVGIVRETYGNWERRVPLIPDHVKELTESGFKVVVQPSSRRIFQDSEYIAAGAEINEDLSAATVILGVKQVPVPNLIENKSYMFFSHTIKAQEENMELLDNCIAKNITLFDYECIVDPKDGKRMVAFGQFAGIVGMVDMFQGLGQRLLADGFSTPFLLSSTCYMKNGLDEVEEMVKSVGEKIKKDGLNSALNPIVFSFTGDGNVGQGAKRMFELLPVTMVKPEDLPALMEREKGKPQHTVYGCYLGPEHLARRKDGKPFNKEDYYSNPSAYQGSFHDKIAPYTTVLVNGMYWDARFPRLLTTEQMKELSAKGRPTLRAISDITCDLGGSLEFCENSTYFENPYYEWDAATSQAKNVGGSDNGVAVLAVDILPTALPRDASKHFGNHLMPILKDLLEAQKLGGSTTSILRPAMITHQKALCKNYQYIQQYRDDRERVESGSRHLTNRPRRVVLVQGHLFDSKFINTAFDMAEKKGDFEIMDFMVVPNLASGPRESQVILGLSGDDEATVDNMYNDIVKLGSLLDVRIQELDKDVHLHTDVPKSRAKPARKVLLLGSGLVAGPIVDYLSRDVNRRQVTIVSDSKEAAQLLAARAPGSAVAVELAVQPDADATGDWSARLDELIREADVVMSLLPPPFHPSIARRCIRNKSHLVTASYVSPEMATLHEEAKASGIVILNEMGLDPGIDHMSAMKLIDEAKEKGAAVKSFSSVCGGLTSPQHLHPDNPLQYTFSWSPAGVMSASLTPAKFLKDGQLIDIDGTQKLYDAAPFYGWPSLNLESSANRDSVVFGDIYGISDTADTVFRGTLRFEGWCKLMFGFTKLGLLDAEHATQPGQTWEELLNNLANDRGYGSPRDLLLDCLDAAKTDKVLAALDWLGATGELPAGSTNATTAMVSLLSDKLSLKPGENDLVLMRHDFKFEYPNGEKHETFSSMMMFGNENETAMAKTVGLTAAIGANLILEGHLDDRLGLASPMLKEVYNPALERLEAEGVTFLEKTTITK